MPAEDISLWKQILEALTNYGLGGILSVVIAIIFLVVLRHLVYNWKEDRKNYNDMIVRRDVLLNNHIGDLTEAVIKLNESVRSHDQRSVDGNQRIVDAINSQTEILRSYINQEDEKNGGGNGT